MSISAGELALQVASPLAQVTELRANILANHIEAVYETLIETTNVEDSAQIDFILDNAGMELVGDLCLAELLLEAGLAAKVVFHVKAMPWFVSDTTAQDFGWTLEMLRGSQTPSLNHLGHKWHARLADGTFEVRTNDFWTLPHPFCQMSQVAPNLYEELGHSKLLIFKGDLNYRKLTSDLKWPYTTPFKEALRGFCPAPLVTLRALKADVVVGLEDSVVQKFKEEFAGSTAWMTNGDYAVIQFLKP